MSAQDWLTLLRDQYQHLDLMQALVLVFGVSEVLLARANNPLLYPAGILSTALAIISLFTVQLYAECLLHGYYLVMSVDGWGNWTEHENKKAAEVGRASRQEWIIALLIGFAGMAFLYFMLTSFTDSDVPLWDAWVSSTGWAGMWLLARRRTENWILLNVSNAFAIPLLFQKQLPLFALLTVFLFIVACFGYFDWLKIERRQRIEAGRTNASL